MQYTLFAGCSYTYGSGFLQEKDNDDLWVNILHKNVKELSETQILNVAFGGRSNAGIFADAVYNLTKYNCKYAFVEWTSCPRYELELGLETYSTRQCFIPNAPTFDHNLNDCTYTSSYLNGVRDRFTSLAHPHYEIKNLICYINSLVKIANLTNTKIFFINGACPWDAEYFTQLTNTLPDSFTKFTKKILNVDNRSDDEIFAIYNKIHNQYKEYGGIQENYWLNLYHSISSEKIDTNSDNQHPGKLSNQIYAERFSLEFKNKI
jgi:hypothetical protein